MEDRRPGRVRARLVARLERVALAAFQALRQVELSVVAAIVAVLGTLNFLAHLTLWHVAGLSFVAGFLAVTTNRRRIVHMRTLLSRVFVDTSSSGPISNGLPPSMSHKLIGEADVAQYCTDCGEPNCKRMAPRALRAITHPWEGLKVYEDVDDKLATLFEALIDTYVNSWYKNMSQDVGFEKEMRHTFRFVTAALYRRFQAHVDLNAFVLETAIPLIRDHLVLCSHAHRQLYVQSPEDSGRLTKAQLRRLEVALVTCSVDSHFGARSETNFNRYCQLVAERILPHLVSPQTLSSPVCGLLLREFTASFGIRTVISLLTSADFINSKLLFVLEPSPSSDTSGEASNGNSEGKQEPVVDSAMMQFMPRAKVELLSRFAAMEHNASKEPNTPATSATVAAASSSSSSSSQQRQQPALATPPSVFTTRLPTILQDMMLSVTFQRFLTGVGKIELLNFVLAVEDFLQHEPMLSPEEKRKQAIKLHDALQTVHQKDNGFVIQPKILRRLSTDRREGNFNAQTFLAAHTTAYNTLEQELLPQFVQSVHYFQYVLGKPAAELPMTGSDASTSSSSKANSRHVPKPLTLEELAAMDLPKPPSETADDAVSLMSRSATGEGDVGSGAPTRNRSQSSLSVSESAPSSSMPDSPMLLRSRSQTTSSDTASSTRDTESLASASEVAETISSTQSDLALLVSTSSSTAQSTVLEGGDTLPVEEADADGDADEDDETQPDDEPIVYSLEGVTAHVRQPRLVKTMTGSYWTYPIQVLQTKSAAWMADKEDMDEAEPRKLLRFEGGTNQHAWVVARRFREFDALESILRSLFPDTLPFPDKKPFKKVNPTALEERRRALSTFLQAILANRLMLVDQPCCVVIYHFLHNGNTFKRIVSRQVSIRRLLGTTRPSKQQMQESKLAQFLSSFSTTQADLDEATLNMQTVQALELEMQRQQEEQDSLQNDKDADNAYLPATTSKPLPRKLRASQFRDEIFKYQDLEDSSWDMRPVFHPSGPTDDILKALFSVFQVKPSTVTFPVTALLRTLGSSTADDIILRIVPEILDGVLTATKMEGYIELLHNTLFSEEQTPRRTLDEMQQSEERLRALLKGYLPGKAKHLFGPGVWELGIDNLVTYLQSPILNHQLMLTIFDAFIDLLFPETNHLQP
eukprot:m.38315 g.38315  ORF g.38315 m.38315 type:complete len:1149 (+) comp10186_c0_seq3:277-3723(+)